MRVKRFLRFQHNPLRPSEKVSKKENQMHQFCFTVNGQRHCFDVPTLIDQQFIRKPPINNYPPFELAVSVLQLVAAVPHSELSAELTNVAQRFINQVKGGMPKGVELIAAGQAEYASMSK